MQIMNATEEDKDELLALYHAMIGGPCEWSETYPDENTIAFDLKNEDLFVMKNMRERSLRRSQSTMTMPWSRSPAGMRIRHRRENCPDSV